MSMSSYAYYYGGMHLTLVSCTQKYDTTVGRTGYVGTYKSYNGDLYSVFFGSNYCKY